VSARGSSRSGSSSSARFCAATQPSGSAATTTSLSRHPSRSSVRVDGPRAGADVRPRGGTWTFKTASIGLRKAGGRWQLDRLKGGTLDRAALSARLRKGPRSASDELPDGVHNCLLRVLRTSDDKELVRAIVGPDVHVFLLPSVICGLGPAPYARGVPSSVRTCVARPHQRVIKLGGEDDRDRSQAKRLAVTGSLRPSLLRQDLLRMKMYLRSEWALYIRTRLISR
jgi:hypothetical protein